MTKYFYRYLTEKIQRRFRTARIIIIIGARQTGKTNIVQNYLANYASKRSRRLYFDFEQTNDVEIFQDVNHFQTYLLQQRIVGKSRVLLAIDEFQYLKNATKFFKIIHDHYPHIQILATGSSAIEMQKHLRESLAGRKTVYDCYPLSFEEYLLAANQADIWTQLRWNMFLPAQLERLNATLLKDYLLWGGYPRLSDRPAIPLEGKKEELHDIFNAYAHKDVKGIIGGENILAFNNLVKLLAAQIGQLVNVNELANTTKLSRYEVEKYLAILESTYIIKRVPPLFSNKRKEISKMPKIYFSDLGLANMVTSNFSPITTRPNVGSLIENYVLNQLYHFVSVSDSVFFWRSLEGAEVDFIWQKDAELIPIEVKWKNFSEPLPPASVIHFIKKHQAVRQAFVVNKNYFGQKKVGRAMVTFVPAALVGKRFATLR